MKIILPLLILISMFSYLLAGTFSCPSFHYICCLSDSLDSCKCFSYAVETECKSKVTCVYPSQCPVLIQDGTNIKVRCID